MESNLSSKNVMVVGGGVAGMAAAKTLNDHGINVYIVEKITPLAVMLPTGHAWLPTPAGTARHA